MLHKCACGFGCSGNRSPVKLLDGEPTGILATAGISIVTLGAGNGAAFSSENAWSALMSMETAFAGANCNEAALAFLTNGKVRGQLRTCYKAGATVGPEFVWSTEADRQVKYPVACSSQVSSALTAGTASGICSAIIMADFSEIVVGEYAGGAIDVTLDPFTLSENRIIRLLGHQFVDILTRRPSSVCVIKDCITGRTS